MKIKAAPKTYVNKSGEQVIEIGFSGSRIGMSHDQMGIITASLRGKTGIAHHGDCIGSDAEFHDILRNEFPGKWRIVIHPPVKNELRAFKLGDEVRPPKTYYDRNKDIVDACNVFYATPKDTNETGGTWYTINYFRKVLEYSFGNPELPPRIGQIFLPDGRVGNITSKKKGILG